MNQKIYGVNSYYPFPSCPDLVPLIRWTCPHTMRQMVHKGQTYYSSSICGSQPGLPLLNSWCCLGALALNIFVACTCVLRTCWPWPQNFLKTLVQTHFSGCLRYNTLPQLFNCNSNSGLSAFTYVPTGFTQMLSGQNRETKGNLGCCQSFKDDFLPDLRTHWLHTTVAWNHLFMHYLNKHLLNALYGGHSYWRWVCKEKWDMIASFQSGSV